MIRSNFFLRPSGTIIILPSFSLHGRFLRNAAAAIVVYEITSAKSFANAKALVLELRAAHANIVIALAGNKNDLAPTKRKVEFEEARAFAEENGAFQPRLPLFCSSTRRFLPAVFVAPPVLTRNLQASRPWKRRPRHPTMFTTCLLRLVILTVCVFSFKCRVTLFVPHSL
jgi:GTPase SAR1 family protein